MADKPHITREGYVAALTKVGYWATPQSPIQYAFLEQRPAYVPNEPGWVPFSAAQRAAAQNAFAMIAEVVNLTFVQVPDNQQQPGPGNPRIAFYANNTSLAYSGAMFAFRNQGSEAIYGADIRFNNARIAQRTSNEGFNDFTSFVAIHEVLHALGLSHPGEYNGQGPTYQNDAEFAEDTIQYSVMSYFSAANTGADHFIGGVQYVARTPLLYDILALQSLYSPNMSTRSGDTVYGFNSNTGAASPFNFAVTTAPVVAIWDAGGIDTIDLSGYGGASLIDLNEGAFSDAGGLTKNIAIAFNVTIENAVGGPGQDRLIGNAAANGLDGGAGADQMEGGPGDDVFIVDDSGDVVIELAGAGRDEVRTSLATYVLPANVEVLAGTSAAAQTLTGNELANTIDGGTGPDTLVGGGGWDMLIGGQGNEDVAVFAGNRADYAIDTSGPTTVRDLNPSDGDDGTDTLDGIEFARFADSTTQLGIDPNNPPQLGLPGMVDQSWGDGAAASYTVPATAFFDQDAGQTLLFVAALANGSPLPSWLAFDPSTRTFSGTPPLQQVGTPLTVRVTASDGKASVFDDFEIAVTQSRGSDVKGTAGADVLNGTFRVETMFGDDGDDVLLGSAGADRLDGHAGTDTADYSGSAQAVTVNLVTGFGAGGDAEGDELISIERVTGSAFADTILGGADQNLFDGGAGADRLEGGSGDDTYIVDDGGDLVVEAPGEGIDEVRTALASYSLGANVERLTGTASSVQTLSGNALANIVTGGAGNDQIHGNGGSDDLRGGSGNDWLHVSGTGIVAASGGADFDYLKVDWGDSTTAITMGFPNADPNGGLTGTIGDGGARRIDYSSINIFQITTGSGDDLLYGGQSGSGASLGGGNDRFYGMGGWETVDGGSGRDGVSAGLGLATTPVVWNLQTNSYSSPIGSYTNFEYFLGIFTGSANDIIVTTAANLDDIVNGAAGDDTITVINGQDHAAGDFGNDLLIIDYSGSANAIATTGGAAGIALGDNNSGVKGQIGDGGSRRVNFFDVDRFDVRTGSGDDSIFLGTGSLVTSDVVSLGGGNDSVDFGRGADQGDGGAGVDSLAADFSQAATPISLNLVTNAFSGPAGSGFVNFEYLGGAGFRTGSGGDIVVTGQLNLNDLLLLGGGADSATVHDGFDTVDGQAGTDLLIVDYSAATAAVTTIGGAGGISGGTEGSGVRGRIGDGGTRRIDFDNIDRFDIRTGSGNDVVILGSVSLSTNDIVSLGGGDDSVDFGAGIDVGDGGAGVDSLNADLSSAGAAVSINLVTNSFSGPAGISFVNFEYFGGSGFQTGQGADTVVTALLNRNDRVSLGAGNDSITLHDGRDTVFGGGAGAGTADSGFDTLILDYGAATAAVHNIGGIVTYAAGAFGQIGDDSTRLATFEAIDRFLITTGSGNDSIATAGGNDEIRTGGGADSIAAGAGNDLLDGGSGPDTMSGGQGDDIYIVDDSGDVVSEVAGEGSDEVRTGLAAYSLAGLAYVEKLTASSDAAHDFRGNSGTNTITGGGGADTLRLHDGGDDTVFGAAGNDNIFFIGALTGADVVNGGAGVDTLVLQGPYGALTLTGNITQIENVSILGGNNTSFGEPGTNRYDYVLTTHNSNFAAGVQARINASALQAGEDFTFNGSAETDASYVVYGGKGKDTLLGGQGNDIFFYAEERFASGDTVNGGAGYDGMFLRGNYTIDFNAPGYTGLFTNIENLTLTSATDERYARGGGTEFDYNLTLSDSIVGAGQELTISGALLMASETMVLDASAETNGTLRLFGGKASDTLKGGSLNDLLHGNFGADMLAGGGGADTFRYQAVNESYSVARDHILDFTPGTDRIDLERIDASRSLAGDQAFTWIGSNAFSGSAGQLRAFQSGSNWIVEGDINGDGHADLIIALTLQGPTPLGAGDFLL